MQRLDWKAVSSLASAALQFLPHRSDRAPIDTVGKLTDFVDTRSAFIAQTSLYGYLKTRMGTRYPELFQDDVFVKAINGAKWRVYAACLSDLTLYVAGYCVAAGAIKPADTAALAEASFQESLANGFTDPDAALAHADALARFKDRLGIADWATLGESEGAFSQSPADLVTWAPVSDEFKQEDREIIENSIRFRWHDVRVQWRKRAKPEAIAEDWRIGRATPRATPVGDGPEEEL